MNAGLYAYDEKKLRAAVAELNNDNAQSEYYLTDTIGGLVARGKLVHSYPHSWRSKAPLIFRATPQRWPGI